MVVVCAEPGMWAYISGHNTVESMGMPAEGIYGTFVLAVISKRPSGFCVGEGLLCCGSLSVHV